MRSKAKGDKVLNSPSSSNSDPAIPSTHHHVKQYEHDNIHIRIRIRIRIHTTIHNPYAEEYDLPGILEIFNEQIASSTAILRDDPFDIDDRRKWMRDIKSAGFPIFVAVPSSTSPNSGTLESTLVEPNTRNENIDADGVTTPSILGFAYYSTFRPRAGYRFTSELTLYIHKSIRGLGIGSALMKTLLSHARDQGRDKEGRRRRRKIHSIIATITSENAGSIRFHEKFGFEEVGRMREVGFKFGKWLDVTFMQLLLLPEGG